MARPEYVDYDPAYDEINRQDIEGLKLIWIGIDPVGNPRASLVFDEGYADAGQIVKVRRRQIDITAEGAVEKGAVIDPGTFVEWYTANKTLFDDLHRAVLSKLLAVMGKTGVVVEV